MADWSPFSTEETQMSYPLDALVSGAPVTPGGEIVAGRYELLGLVGSGGMGRVYRARDRELDEVIALKVLHRDLLGSESTMGRFRQEVKLARRVTHRNVARTFDIGEHEAVRFLTMELIEGESLSMIIARRGGMSVGETLDLALQMCAGMAAAHAADVIHRDLKPDNVLVARDGRVVITDFGIASTHLPGSAGQTSGEVVGTPAYMAPEQVEARPDIDARADIYALGAVMYEALTGACAWPGDAPYVVALARLLKPPPDPRLLRADLPDSIAEIVLRAMALDPDARFQSAASLAEALTTAASAATGREQPSPQAIPAAMPAASTSRDKTVALLAFRNIGPAEDAYLADGLTEDLLDALSSLSGLRVRCRGLSAGSGDAAEEGRRLGVDVVVEGSVRRTRDGFRVNARLVGSHDGFQIWAARFERPVSAAFALNDEVARAIAAALSTTADAPLRSTPTDPMALDLYLRGRHELSRHWMGEHEQALALLTEAVERAPDDPTILSAYATARVRNALLQGQPAPDLDAIVARALRAASDHGEPWVALAVLRWNAHDDAVGAIRAVKQALKNAPNLADANDQAGRLLLEAGEMEEATLLLERALWLDAGLPWARLDLMRAAAYRRQWSKVESLYEARSDAAWHEQARGAYLRYLVWRGDPTVLDGLPPVTLDKRSARFAPLLEEVLRTGQLSASHRSFLRRTAEALPPRARARRWLTQLATEVHVFAEDDDEAARYLQSSVDAGVIDRAWIEQNPLLRRYRGQPWFEAARKTIGDRAALVVEAWRAPLLGLPVA